MDPFKRDRRRTEEWVRAPAWVPGCNMRPEASRLPTYPEAGAQQPAMKPHPSEGGSTTARHEAPHTRRREHNSQT